MARAGLYKKSALGHEGGREETKRVARPWNLSAGIVREQKSKVEGPADVANIEDEKKRSDRIAEAQRMIRFEKSE